MAPFSIIRIKKLKSWGAIAGAAAHNARTRETPNADPGAPCRFLIGSRTDDPVALCQARLGDRKIRKNAVYGVDGFLGASPEYFRPDAPGQYGLAYEDRLNAWVEASLAWLRGRYGDRIINAVLHLDEATPHIQYLLLPLDDKGQLNCKALFGGSKHVLSQLQSDYADAMAHLGLARGRQGSKATHVEVAEYYAHAKAIEATPMPSLPKIENIELPEPPGALARMKTENLLAYAQEAGLKAIEARMAKLAPELESLVKRSDSLTAENARLRQELEQLKDSNSQLSQANADFKAAAKRMRDLDLEQVLVKMFGAVETSGFKPKRKTFTLPDGLNVEVADGQWRVQDGPQQKGAVNLAMYLSGYGQDHYQQAVRDLAEIFGDQDVTSSLANHLAATAPREADKIRRQKYQTPEPCQHTWPQDRYYLIDQIKLPPPFVDKAHEDGLVFSDQRRNLVFPRDGGVFKIGTGERPFSQTLGKDGGPFVMPGLDGQVYIVESSLEALCLKAMKPESAILATGGFLQMDKLKPYLDQKEVFITQGQAAISGEVAGYFLKHLPNAKRLQPPKGQTWQECRLLQIEEAEKARKEAQATARAGFKIQAPGPSR